MLSLRLDIVRILFLFCFVLRLDPFRTAVPFWGQTTQISSGLSPQPDCAPTVKGLIVLVDWIRLDQFGTVASRAMAG